MKVQLITLEVSAKDFFETLDASCEILKGNQIKITDQLKHYPTSDCLIASFDVSLEKLFHVSVPCRWIKVTYSIQWPLAETQDGRVIEGGNSLEWKREQDGNLSFETINRGKPFDPHTYQLGVTLKNLKRPLTKEEKAKKSAEEEQVRKKEEESRKREEVQRKESNLAGWRESLKGYLEDLEKESKRIKKILELPATLESYQDLQKEYFNTNKLMWNLTEDC
jgi:hypothetical protein